MDINERTKRHFMPKNPTTLVQRSRKIRCIKIIQSISQNNKSEVSQFSPGNNLVTPCKPICCSDFSSCKRKLFYEEDVLVEKPTNSSWAQKNITSP